MNKSHKNGWVVVDRDDDNKDHWAHEHTNNPANRVDISMNKTTAIVTASMSMDAATLHHNPAKASQDQGN